MKRLDLAVSSWALLIALLVAVPLTLTGCSSTEPTGNLVVNARDAASLDTVAGELAIGAEPSLRVSYLKDDNAEVAAVKQAVEAYQQALLNVDYTTQTGMETVPFLSQAGRSDFVDTGYGNALVSSWRAHQIKRSYDGVEYSDLVFSSDRTLVRVDHTSFHIYQSFSEEIANEGKDTGARYGQPFTLYLVKEDGVWKVLKFEAGGLY